MKTPLELLKEKFLRVNGELDESDFEEMFDLERKILISAHHDGQMYGIRNALSSTGESVKYVIDNYPIHNTFKK